MLRLCRSLTPKKWKFPWKAITFSVVWCAVFIAVMLTMQWLLKTKLEEFQSDAFTHLDGQLFAGTNSAEPIFTFKNGGLAEQTDMPKHQIICSVKSATYGANLAHPDMAFERNNFTMVEDSDVTLTHGGGDGESVACLSEVNAIASSRWELACADLIFEYRYVIASDPTKWNEKKFRFATHQDGDHLGWHRELVNKTDSNCHVQAIDESHYNKVTVCPLGCTYTDLQTAADSVSCGTVIYTDSHQQLIEKLRPKTACDANHWIVIKAGGIPNEMLGNPN